MNESLETKARCYRCFRPQRLCLCATVTLTENTLPVLIVQHPRERKHAFNTARLAELCLRNVAVAVDHSSRLRHDAAALNLLPGAALLYPHASARDVSTLPAAERPSQLVVIDGTWHQAHTLYRDIPQLQALPHLTLPPAQVSQFDLRRQPALHYLSTIEAIAVALRYLEPDAEGLPQVLRGFQAMVQRQLVAREHHGRERKGLRTGNRRWLPRALLENREQLVVGHAEVVPGADGERRVVAWVAERLATGERFESLLRVAGASPKHLSHMGLAEDDLQANNEQFRAAWQDFLRPGDVLAVWNRRLLDALHSETSLPEASVLLKAAYNQFGRERGPLATVIEKEQLSNGVGSDASRRFQRLGNSVAIAKLLLRLADEP